MSAVPWWKKKRTYFELLLAIVFIVGIQQWQARSLLQSSTTVPVSQLPVLNKNSVADLPAKGDSLIYFFAPWCTVCHFSIGNLSDIQRRFPELNVQIVALDYQSESEVAEFIAKQRIDIPVLLGDRATLSSWQVSMFPSYYIIDSEQTVVNRSVGYSSEWGMSLGIWWALL